MDFNTLSATRYDPNKMYVSTDGVKMGDRLYNMTSNAQNVDQLGGDPSTWHQWGGVWSDIQNLGYQEFEDKYGGSKQDYWNAFNTGYSNADFMSGTIREDDYNDITRQWQAWSAQQQQIEVDEDGDGRTDYLIDPLTFEVKQDYRNVNSLMEEAQQVSENGIQSFDEWAAANGAQVNDITGSDQFQGLSSLIDFYESGGMTPEVQTGAQEYAASQIGMSVEDYNSMMGNMTNQLAQGVSGQAGLPPEERALREREIRNQTRFAEERASRMLENIASSSGSSARYLMAADSAMRAINDQEVASQVALADEVFQRQLADFQGKQAQYDMLLKNNQISKSQYLDIVMQNKATAFSAYAAQVDMMYKENAQYFQQYNQDLQAVQQHIDNIYTAINAEMGMNQQIHQMIMDEWGMSLQEWQMQMQQEALEMQRDAMDNASSGGFLEGLTNIIGTFVPAVNAGIQAADYFGWGEEE